MKAFIYPPEAIGRTAWPEGTLRLEGTETVVDPKDADVFVCPGGLHVLRNPADLDLFPFMKGNESRHVFFDVSDFEQLYSKGCMFIRSNARTWYLDKDPNTIAWSWPVDDYAECIEVPASGFTFDVSFHGWNWSDVRKHSTQSCWAQKNLSCDFALYHDFFGHLKNEAEIARRRAAHRQSIRESRLVLCPESIPGVFPYRFWEAMSAARIPVLVGSEHVFPFEDEINYQSFGLFIPRGYAELTGERIEHFLATHSDEEIIEFGRRARSYWEQYINRDKWPQLMTLAVEKKLRALAA